MRTRRLALSAGIWLAITFRVTSLGAQLPGDSARALDFEALRIYRDIGLGRSKGRPDLERSARLWLQAADLHARAGDSISALDRRVRALRVWSERGWRDSVLAGATRLAEEARLAGDTPLEWAVQFELAAVLHGPSAGSDSGAADSALRIYRRAFAAHAARGDRWTELRAAYGLATVHNELGHADSARHYALLVQSRFPDVAAERRQIAMVAGTSVGITGARAMLDSALATSRRIGDRFGEGQALALLGQMNLSLGRSDSADSYFVHALNLAHAGGDRAGQRFTAGAILGSVEATLDPAAERYPWDATGEAGILVGLSAVQVARGDTALARASLGRALVLARQQLDPQLEIQALQRLALLDERAGDFDSALTRDSTILWLAGAIATKYGGDWEGNRAAALSHSAVVYLATGREARARQAIDSARAAVRTAGRTLRATVYEHIADFHRRLHGPADLAAAIAYYDSAATVLASELFASSNRDDDRISLSEQYESLQEDRVLAHLAGDSDSTGRAQGLSALAAHEDGLAVAMRNLMAGDGRQSVTGVLGLSGKELASTARLLVTMLSVTHSAALKYALTRDTLITWLILPDGNVRVHRRAVARDTVVKMAMALRLSLGVETAAADTAHGPPALEPTGARRGLVATGRGDTLWRDHATALAELLLPADLLSLIPADSEVVVVPQDIVAMVPFAVLPLRDGQLLGLRYALRYAPSLSILDAAEDIGGERWSVPQSRWTMSPAENSAWLASRLRTKALGRPLVFANPRMPTVRDSAGRPLELPPLRSAAAEGAGIATQLGTSVSVGEAASESALRARIASATIVHLATHGYAFSSEARAGDSFIALAPGRSADGLLTVNEIMTELPPLVAELVVLSACQTGLGNLREAEGTVGLQRAFLARGSRSVLVSLWNVSDRATAQLMTAFYRHWLTDADHPSKAMALLRAERTVHDSTGFFHPRDWAAFQMVGAR